MAPVQLKLFVFIIRLNTLFPVTIESSETVGDLKESIVIENPNDLKGVDADRLFLYQVELPDDDTLEQSAAQAVNARRPLRPSHLLSGLFPANPPVETVNIVVKVESPGEWGNGSPVYLIGPISLYLSLRFARLWLFSNDICTSPWQAIASCR